MTDAFAMYARGMKRGIYWPRVLAVCSAVALGGGYVLWSQMKFQERQAREAEAQEEERVVLPGSKSAWGFPRNRSTSKKGADAERTNADFIQEAPVDGETRAELPSSKIGVIPLPGGEEKKPEERKLLPGSKRIDAILSPSDVEEKP